MNYRIYLLSPDAHVQAAEFFEASDDLTAKKIAVGLHRSCCDAFAGYELWRGTEHIAPDDLDRSAQAGVEAFIQAHQDNIVDLEERLDSSFRILSKSRQLLALSTRWRTARGIMGPGEPSTIAGNENATIDNQTGTARSRGDGT